MPSCELICETVAIRTFQPEHDSNKRSFIEKTTKSLVKQYSVSIITRCVANTAS